MKRGIELIIEQRNDQLEKHGYSLKSDLDLNRHYQLSQAAGLLTWLDEEDYGHDVDACCPVDWNPDIWRKMMSKSYIERLAIAGALCAAEIDRMDHLDKTK